jgi:fluoride ion exporter CrcB/FEX
MYNLWNNNGKCPPVLMAQTTWVTAFLMKSAQFTSQGNFRIEFLSRPGLDYTIEYKDSLTPGGWQTFVNNGTFTATTTLSSFQDDFTANSSGSAPATGQRYYRFRYSNP